MNSAQAIVFISVWLTLVVNGSWLTNILLGLSAPTLDKFFRDFWRGQTNFVSPVLPGLMKQCMESVITFYQSVRYDNDSLYLLLLKRLFDDYLQWCVSTACKATNVSRGTIMYSFQKNKVCGETTIPSVSWAWGNGGISYTLLLIRKRTITTLLHWPAKKGSRISMPKLDHEMFRDYFGGNLWRSDFFRIRSGFCQSDAIRSRFC